VAAEDIEYLANNQVLVDLTDYDYCLSNKLGDLSKGVGKYRYLPKPIFNRVEDHKPPPTSNEAFWKWVDLATRST